MVSAAIKEASKETEDAVATCPHASPAVGLPVVFRRNSSP